MLIDPLDPVAWALPLCATLVQAVTHPAIASRGCARHASTGKGPRSHSTLERDTTQGVRRYRQNVPAKVRQSDRYRVEYDELNEGG